MGDYIFVLGGDGMDNYFNSFDNTIVYASSQNGGLRRSSNGGSNFGGKLLPNADSATFYPWITPIVQHPPKLFPPANLDVIYAYSLNGILKSTNSGLSWNNMGPAGIGTASGSRTPSMVIGSHDGGVSANLYISNGNSFWVHTNPLQGTSAGWV